ncbi:hypothetical protein V6N13_073280 [Hibiscus sabdariffa]
MAPPMEGFFVGAFQPYSSMTSAPSNVPGPFYPSAPMFQTFVPPLAVYPPSGPDSASTMGWFSIHRQVPYSPLARGGAVFVMMTRTMMTQKLMRTRTTLKLFEEIPQRNHRPPRCGTRGRRRH